MIQKLSRIENIGSFLFYDWETINPPNPGNGEQKCFKKYNILFGENGNGKSTITRILKSLNNNSNDLAKHWDKNENDRAIVVNVEDEDDLTFVEGSGWSDARFQDRFLFFDKSFIEQYVHSGPIVRDGSQDKETGKLILYLGNFHSYKTQLDKIKDIQEKIRSKSGDVNSRNSELLKVFPNDKDYTGSIDEVIQEYGKQRDEKKGKDSTIEKLVENKEAIEKRLEKIRLILKRSAEILRLPNLKKIEKIEPLDLKKVTDAFDFSVSKGATDVLKKIKGKEDFIKDGTDLITDQTEDCPFCEQPILDSENNLIDIIIQYRKLFDDEFLKKQEINNNELISYNAILNSLLTVKPPESNQENLANINRVLSSEFVLHSLSLDENDKAAIQMELQLVQKKLGKPLEPLNSEFTNTIVEIIQRLNDKIKVFNDKIEEINKFLIKNKEEIDKGTKKKEEEEEEENLKKLRIKIFILRNRTKIDEYIHNISALDQNKNTLEQLSELFRKFRDIVNEEFAAFVDKYFEKFQRQVNNLTPTLEVFKIEKRNLRYDARSNEVVCGFEVRYKNIDRFRDLSEGEKQVIALAFFFALLETENDQNNKIVVFDDPITSFDSGKRRQAAELIYFNTMDLKQTFISTCDPLFKYYCLKVIDGNKRSLFHILKSASSAIHFINKQQATIYSAFRIELQDIDNQNGTEQNIVIYGQKLRYCVEEVKQTYLGYGEDNFSNILDKVKSKDFNQLKSKIPDLKQIYSFCNTGGLSHYPRDGITTWTELRFYTKKFLNLGL